MINNKKAESLLWIIIWIFILAIVILWISNILITNKMSMWEVETDLNETLLKQNSINIWNLVDTSKLVNNETFYIKKWTWSFEVLTWSLNEKYKYININWEYISDITNYELNIYTREYKINYLNNIYTNKNTKKIYLYIKKIK